jgi:hypothetical protein
MIKLKDLLLEAPAKPAPAPAKPERSTEPDVAPGRPAKPQPRRRSVPSPETSPTPAPKAEKQQGKKEPAHQAPKDKDKQGPSSVNEESDVMKKIIDRYMKAFNKLSEAEYEKIFDPETLNKLKGSVVQRIQGKNPMQIRDRMLGTETEEGLSQEVARLEEGNEDLLEQLAYSIIYETYPYLKNNEDIIEIDAKIVPQNQVKDALKKDEEGEVCLDCMRKEEEQEMKDDILADLKKRRLINAITQGGSTFSKQIYSQNNKIKQKYLDIVEKDIEDKVGKNPIGDIDVVLGSGTREKYNELMQAALDMIDFMTMMAGQGMSGGGGGGMEDSAVGAESVFYDFLKEKWVIKARATCFPVLVLEIVKGMYEIIGLFGFSDLERGEKVVQAVDKIQNEPADISYGQTIAKKLFDVINSLESNVTPEERDDFLQDIYKLSNEEFIKLITNVINNKIDTSQMNMLKGKFSQMRQDKTADDADNALFERWARIAGLR